MGLHLSRECHRGTLCLLCLGAWSYCSRLPAAIYLQPGRPLSAAPHPSSRQQELSPVIGPVTAHSEAIEQAPSDGPNLHSGAESRERPPQRSESRAVARKRTGWRLVPVLIRPRRRRKLAWDGSWASLGSSPGIGYIISGGLAYCPLCS